MLKGMLMNGILAGYQISACRQRRRSAEAPQAMAHRTLADLGHWLQGHGYRFTTVTPETQRRVTARPGAVVAHSLRDVFGWSLPFPASLLPAEPLRLLRMAGVLRRDGLLWRSTVRFSSLEQNLFAHSAYPTEGEDAVFFGPDTHRFARLVREVLTDAPRPVRCIVDVGCGSGAGGIVAAQLARPDRLVLADINPAALRFAAANAAMAGMPEAECVASDVLAAVPGPIDLVIANPPYLVDDQARLYRHGGGALGGELSVRIVRESLARLAPGGRLILYSGAPVIDGTDRLWQALRPLLDETDLHYRYTELDPDVFGEELDRPAYAQVERIAAVGLTVERR